MPEPSRRRTWLWLTLLCILIGAVVAGRGFWLAGRTIFDLLAENKKLRSAIANLSAESQIGVVRVLDQDTRDGRLYTRVRFVETARDDPKTVILQRDYEVEGDVVHFDALIVKFGSDYVADGKGRALYLWRRVYGEKMTPETGFPIEAAGAEPQRYAELLSKLSGLDRALFWTEIWKLSDAPDRLKAAGVQAIYGNALYKNLSKGFLYIFKIGDAGQFYLETVPSP